MYLVKLNYLYNGKIVPQILFQFFSTVARAKANATMEAMKDLKIKSATVYRVHPDGEMELITIRIYVPFLGVQARNWFTPEKFEEEPEEEIEEENPREPKSQWREDLKDNVIKRLAELGTIATQLAK